MTADVKGLGGEVADNAGFAERSAEGADHLHTVILELGQTIREFRIARRKCLCNPASSGACSCLAGRLRSQLARKWSKTITKMTISACFSLSQALGGGRNVY